VGAGTRGTISANKYLIFVHLIYVSCGARTAGKSGSEQMAGLNLDLPNHEHVLQSICAFSPISEELQSRQSRGFFSRAAMDQNKSKHLTRAHQSAVLPITAPQAAPVFHNSRLLQLPACIPQTPAGNKARNRRRGTV